MTEEMIDGVDVSECGFLDNHRPTKLLLCNECNSNFEAMECKDYHDCYYKQIKRLEAENAKLKEALEEIREICSNTCDTNKDCVHSCYECKSIDEPVAINRILDKINEVLKYV